MMQNLLTHGILASSLAISGLTVSNTVKYQFTDPTVEGYFRRVTPVVAGTPFTVELHIRKSVGCPGTVTWTWEGQGGFSMMEASNPLLIKTNEDWRVYRIKTFTPIKAPYGALDMGGIIVMDCPGRTITAVIDSVRLNVLAR